MNCWEFLGLEADADARAIKRRYALLLKTHRPDEDAAAFQALRQAYEQALAISSRRQQSATEPDQLLTQPELTDLPPSAGLANLATHPVAQRQSLQSAGRPGLLMEPAPGRLDAALASAEAQGLRGLFEQRLLEYCLDNDAHGLDMANWAVQRLHWLTPWRSAELSAARLAQLAECLLNDRLKQVRAALSSADERTALQLIDTLGQATWLQSFDQRAWFHRRLVELLLGCADWSAAFFDRLCDLCDWRDDIGHQPCDPQQWQALKQQCEGYAILLSLRKHLAEIWPCNAEQKAAWLLLKPLTEVRRRQLVDTFDEQDWQACARLSDTLVHRFPDVLDRLSDSGLHDWRGWAPGEAWSSANAFLWVLLFSTLLLALGASGKVAGKAGDGAFAVAIEFAVTSVLIGATVTVILGILTFLHRGWRQICIWLASSDAEVSRMLLPRAWNRQGTGLLVLRHGFPSLAIGGLAWLWNASFSAFAPVVGVFAALACVVFADFATRGGSFRQLRAAIAERVCIPWRKIGIALLVALATVLMAGLVHKNLGRLQVAENSACVAAPDETQSRRALCS